MFNPNLRRATFLIFLFVLFPSFILFADDSLNPEPDMGPNHMIVSLTGQYFGGYDPNEGDEVKVSDDGITWFNVPIVSWAEDKVRIIIPAWMLTPTWPVYIRVYKGGIPMSIGTFFLTPEPILTRISPDAGGWGTLVVLNGDPINGSFTPIGNNQYDCWPVAGDDPLDCYYTYVELYDSNHEYRVIPSKYSNISATTIDVTLDGMLNIETGNTVPDAAEFYRGAWIIGVVTDYFIDDDGVADPQNYLKANGAIDSKYTLSYRIKSDFAIFNVSYVLPPRTGQTKCYDTAGTEIACVGTGQDGEIQSGVAWPEPRFEDNGNGTMTDNLTGLMWTRDAGTPTLNSCSGGTKTWQGAFDYVTCLNSNNYLGYSDWRLPNVNELESLINVNESDTAEWLAAQGFANVHSLYYWSSTTVANDTNHIWVVYLSPGGVGYDYTDYGGIDGNVFVWPVRTGQYGFPDFEYPANIWKTGQTTSYTSGDDGDLERGVVWPNPRFDDHGNGTVTDNLTGLIWTKDANVPGPSVCAPGANKTWQGALDYVACLNTNRYLGYDDWRLPNRKERRSLIDYSNYNPVLPSVHPFTNVQSAFYWSSTTSAPGTRCAWIVDMQYGLVGSVLKETPLYVWPVRGDLTAPLLVITSHSYGRHVTTASITLAGTASDSGRGDSGIQQVTVDGNRASNDFATGSGTANWSKAVNLNAGANTITVIAYDNSTNHNQTSQTVTIYYDVPDTTAPATTASPVGGTYSSAQSVTLTCNDNGGSGCQTTYYCLGSGCNPTTVYSGSINIAVSATLRFYSTDNADNSESVKTETYTINLPPCSRLTLNSPNGWEIIPSGSQYTINWCPSSNTVKFDLFYSLNGGTSWKPKPIASKITGTSYNWTVPCLNNNKTKALVMVIGYNSLGNVVGYDTSDMPFTIEVVKIVSPNGGELLESGSTWPIMWRTNCTIRPVARVELYYTTGGGIWNLTTTLVGNPGSYNWTVPSVTTKKTKCKVKIVLKDARGVAVGSDVSDKVFTIMP